MVEIACFRIVLVIRVGRVNGVVVFFLGDLDEVSFEVYGLCCMGEVVI